MRCFLLITICVTTPTTSPTFLQYLRNHEMKESWNEKTVSMISTQRQMTEDKNRTKHETLLLILHYLEEEGMSQSAQTLRDEISAKRRGATVRFFLYFLFFW